ncbi:MAG: hypothetical protein J3R72DRAFT_494645 [Linnemannia gamsii]|nr:MAG: hypothetical protein J3R72DRAFT_494645 [Linnemannia gamsii]
MGGVPQGKRKREFIHSDETGQARHTYKRESRTWPRARKGTFVAGHHSLNKTDNGPSSTEERLPQLPSTREHLHGFGGLDYDDSHDLPLGAAIYSSRSRPQLAPKIEAPLISGAKSPPSLHKQEEATTEKLVSIVLPESLASVSSPSLSIQQSYPPDSNSLNDNFDEAATSPILPDAVDDQVEVEEAKKRLSATAFRESTPVMEANNSAALSAAETPDDKGRTETSFKTFISGENDQEQIKTLPFTATPTTPVSNAYNATSSSALPTSATPPPATHRTVYSSHDYAWDTPYHHHYNAWNGGGHYGGYQWVPPTFAGHVPSSMASPSTNPSTTDPSTTSAPPPPPSQPLTAFPPDLFTTSSGPSGTTSN